MQKDVNANPNVADELEVLSILVTNYEEKHYPVPPPHPVEAIRFIDIIIMGAGIDLENRPGR
jgi:HTH-type transcriptional regulator/antitoxin HigA